MPVYKDKNGTWYAMVRYEDWQGERKQKCKRGFVTKREAQNWERRFLLQANSDLDMLFKDFYKLYEQDMRSRLKQNTWEHKAHVIQSKILPYFGDKPMKDIQARDVLSWQNELLRHRDKNGKKSRGYSYTVEEYGNHQDEIRRLNEEKEQALSERDEARAELDKAAKKKVKLDEIESIEAKESMFGKKVTLTKEDYDKLSDTAKKYVAMVKTNKKLRSEHDTAVQERDKLKEQLSAVSSELAAYKKAEKEKALFTREKLNKEAKRISREDELSRKLKKAEAFISACGLSSDYQQFRYNSTIKSKNLE